MTRTDTRVTTEGKASDTVGCVLDEIQVHIVWYNMKYDLQPPHVPVLHPGTREAVGLGVHGAGIPTGRRAGPGGSGSSLVAQRLDGIELRRAARGKVAEDHADDGRKDE